MQFSKGITVFESDQCRYTRAYSEAITEYARRKDIAFKIVPIDNCRDAQNNVHPYGTFSMTLNGKVLTYCPIRREEINEVLNSP